MEALQCLYLLSWEGHADGGQQVHVCPLQQTRTRTRPDQDQTRDRFQGNPAPAPLPALASSGRRAHGATSLLSPADTAPGTGAGTGTGTGTGTPARCALNHQRSSMSINLIQLPFRRKRRTKRGGPFILGASLEPFLVFSSQSLVPISKPFCPLITVQVLLKCLIVAPRATPCKSPQALQYHRAEASVFWSGLVLNREVPWPWG
ncbi:hypothetical protein J3E69DRAFT_182264 [Trichoderma sp. SZMC 28015]